MSTPIRLAIYTRKHPDSPLLALLSQVGLQHHRTLEPVPDAGRWRTSCFGELKKTEEEMAAVWNLGRQQLRWQFAGNGKSYKSLPAGGPDDVRAWGLFLPFGIVQQFSRPMFYGQVELCAVGKVKTLKQVRLADVPTFDWKSERAMDEIEKKIVLAGFEAFA